MEHCDARSSSHTIGGASQVVCLVLRRPVPELGTGVRRRLEHLEDYHRQNAMEVRHLVLGKPKFPRPLRILGAIWNSHKALDTVDHGVHIHLLALSAPGQLLTACIAAIKGFSVTVDVCDSWNLLSLAEESLRKKFVYMFAALAQNLMPRRVGLSYITARDLQSDCVRLDRREVHLVPPTAPTSLLRAAPTSKVTHFGVHGDFDSAHLKPGLSVLTTALQLLADESRPRLEFYGQRLSAVPSDLPGTRNHWHSELLDAYPPDGGVLVLNIAGSGVPNKVVEAVTCQRPMLIHVSLGHLVEPHPWIVLFASPDDLARGLLELPRRVDRGSVTRPMRLCFASPT